MRCSFVVMGEPVAKGRPRVTKTGTTYTPTKTRLYEVKVRRAWEAQSKARLGDGQSLRASLNFWFNVPASYSKAKRLGALSSGAWHTKKPDLDNLVKAVLDALNGYAYDDDSAVCELHVTKRYAADDQERVEVTIEEM